MAVVGWLGEPPRGINSCWYYHWQAKPTGDCYVEMNSVEAAERACHQLHREYMGKRYIEVFQCSASEVKTALTTGEWAVCVVFFIVRWLSGSIVMVCVTSVLMLVLLVC